MGVGVVWVDWGSIVGRLWVDCGSIVGRLMIVMWIGDLKTKCGETEFA